MLALEEIAKVKLTPGLQRLSSDGFVDHFSFQPYSRSQDLSSPRYPDCSEVVNQGVFIDVTVHGKPFFLDFEILGMGYHTWRCCRNTERERPHDFGRPENSEAEDAEDDAAVSNPPSDAHALTKFLYVLRHVHAKLPMKWTGTIDEPDVEYPMIPVRLYELLVEGYVEKFSRRAASQIIKQNPTIGGVLRQAGSLSLNTAEMERKLGGRRYAHSSRPTVYLGEEVKDYERPGFGQKAESEGDQKRQGIFGSIIGWLEFWKSVGGKADYRVVGNKVYLDLPDQFTDVYEALLADKIMVAPEVERLILWESIREGIAERTLEDVVDRKKASEARTLHIKARQFPAFAARVLNMPEPQLRFDEEIKRLLLIPN